MQLEGNGSSLGSYIITGLAILGIALGGAGLYVGVAGRTAERAQDDRLSELEQRVSRLSGATDELNTQVRGLHNQTRMALQSVNDQIVQLREELKPKATALSPAPPASPAASQTAPTTPVKSYTIRPGDLLGKVAKDHGTTVDAILKVNPGLNPSRLKIGQTIQMP